MTAVAPGRGLPPQPAGATKIHDWKAVGVEPDGGLHVIRDFVGSSWTIERADPAGNIFVEIEGIQRADGTTERQLLLLNTDDMDNRLRGLDELDELIRVLVAAREEIAAVDEIEALR